MIIIEKMKQSIMQYLALGLLILAVSLSALAGDGRRVRVGLAWQPNDARYERVVL